jgi:hypothetical protein
MEKNIDMCISNFKYEALKCSCGLKIDFPNPITLWNNKVIKCSCGKMYLTCMSGFAFPLIYTNKHWEIYEGEVLEKIIKKHKKNSY